MFNKTTIMGRICNDLNVHTTEKGDKVLSFKVAVDRKYQVKDAEKKVDFISVVAWRGTAEFIQRNFAKGRMILIDGELQTRQYVDKEKIQRTAVEVVVQNAHFTGEQKQKA